MHRDHWTRCLVLWMTCCVSHGAAVAARAEESFSLRIERLVKPYLDNDIMVGATIGVLSGGKKDILGFGRLDRSDERQPDGDTIYEIGSVSKVFTGVLFADAVTREVGRLDQPAQEWLPRNVKMPRYGERAITLRDLATHVSGLPRLPDNLQLTNAQNPYAAYTVTDLYDFLSGHQLRRAAGETVEYSNLGVGLLGHLVAHQQHTSYEALLRERIAEPLGMESTTIVLDDSERARLAIPHTADGAASINWDLPALPGAGAIRSTAADMLHFAAANLAPPTNELGRAIELAWQVHQQPTAAGGHAIGLGWHVALDGQTRWHNGQTGGYHAMLLVNRAMDAAVVVLANTATSEVDRLAEDVMRTVAGGDVQPRSFEKPVAVPLAKMRRYEGKYELLPGVIFTVTVEGDGPDHELMVGLTGQPTFQVYARSETEWFYRVVDATLTFELDENGKCQALELFQYGVRQRAARIE